jgi:predicted DNA-binding ribbon-helix-helix protein
MTEVKQTRSVTLTSGKKTTLVLEASTWDAIDYIAARECRRWQDWAKEVLDANPDTDNTTGTIRTAAIGSLLARQLGADQATHTQALDAEHEIVGNEYYRLDDEALQSELDAARITHRDSAFNGFEVIAGYRGIPGEPLAPFLCVRSALRDDLHAFIVKTDEGGTK